MEQRAETSADESPLPGTPPGCNLANYATRPVEFHRITETAPGTIEYEGEHITRDGEQFTLRVTGTTPDEEAVLEYTRHLEVCIEAVRPDDELQRALDALAGPEEKTNTGETGGEEGPTVTLDIEAGPDVPRPTIMHVLLDPYIDGSHNHQWVSAEWVSLQVTMGRAQLRGVAGADVSISAVGNTGTRRAGGGCVVRGLAGRSKYRLYGGKHLR